MTTETRCYCFDFLRVFGAFAVMVLHVAASKWGATDIHTFEWEAMNFYDSIVRWAVPVFVMISGALFLSRDIPVRKIYGKYIFRIFTAFVFWAFFYVCLNDADVKILGIDIIHGHFLHMWFLFMIAGLYMIVPFVKKIAESESLTKYFLVLAFLFAFVLPQSVEIISLFSEKYVKYAGTFAEHFHLKFVGGFTAYFLLGYFLNNAQISPRAEYLIYIAGIAGFAATVLMSLHVSLLIGKPSGFYNDHNVNVMFESISVFVFFKEKFNRPSRIIRALSQYSFGAYLVHVAVIGLIINKLGLNTLAFTPAISIPVISVIVFVISFAISAALNHIPFINKYIV